MSWSPSGTEPRRERGTRWSGRSTRARRSTSSWRRRPPLTNLGVMAVAIAVRARLFARLREQAGTDTENVELPAGSTVADVYEAIQKLHPGLQADQSAVRVALNQEFTDWDSKVADGDEVA